MEYPDIEQIIKNIQDANEVEIMEFDFSDCFKALREYQQLKVDAYFMRYHIHQQGLHGWLPDQKKRMEDILYGEDGKLKR